MNRSKCGLNPGSSEAIEKGCTCSAKDNRYGRGHSYVGGVPEFLIDSKCPLHGKGSTNGEHSGKRKGK